VRLPRLFRTTSFRLAALFALIFSLSAVAVGVFVYINVKATLNLQEHARIQSDALALKGEYDSGGMSDMMTAIGERQHNKIAGGLDYSIFRADGTRLYGNLPKMLLKSGWKHIYGPPDGDEPPGQLEQLLVLRERLTPNLWLAVGADIGQLRYLRDDFVRIFALGLILALTLAVGGGVLVSVTFLQRIDAITRTAEAIIEGDIGQRILLNGSGDDLDRLASSLNRMLDRINLLMDTLRHVSTDIAHDLRTPLGHLRQALDDARTRASSMTEYQAAVERAIAGTDAILDTFAGILRIAQIESGSRRAGFRRIELSEIVASVTQTFAPTAEDQGRALVARIDPGIAVDGDSELVTQLAVNLIDNAIRHTPKGTNIWVRLSAAGKGALLEVADDGAGVPLVERERIFERFYRCERSRTTAGNGLGLSLVSAVANLHHATISVLDNAPGLKVRVQFPP
jgi:signal transduction histidine kinase